MCGQLAQAATAGDLLMICGDSLLGGLVSAGGAAFLHDLEHAGGRLLDNVIVLFALPTAGLLVGTCGLAGAGFAGLASSTSAFNDCRLAKVV